jgi:hypothetical protein
VAYSHIRKTAFLLYSTYCTVRSESRCALKLRYVDLVVNIEVVEERCCFTVFSCWTAVEDGATAHTANNSMKLLDETFGERVISRNLWPPCSPDLTESELYLWGAAKSAVHCDRPCKLNESKTAITAFMRNIPQTYLQKVFVLNFVNIGQRNSVYRLRHVHGKGSMVSAKSYCLSYE